MGRVRVGVRRRPVLWLSVTAVLMLLVGVGIGVGGSPSQSELDDVKQERADLAAANAGLRDKLTAAEGRATEAEQARDEATKNADEALAEARRITARGRVPDLTGDDAAAARENTVVGDFDWDVKSSSRVASAEPGTVIAQSPRAGATLARGAKITVFVARKPPPKPKQWVTIYRISGAGSRRTGEFTIPEYAKVRVRYSYGGDDNSTLQLKTPDEGDDSFGDLIVNEIGVYSGVSRLYGKSGTYYLDVSGGSWTIEVQVFKRPT